MTLDPAHPDTLPVRYTGQYALMEIPPKCRNPRPVRHEADFTLPVRSVTGEQAPVALTYPTGRDTARPVVLRFFDGRLYRTVTHQVWPKASGGRGAPTEVATEYGSEQFPTKTSLITHSWGTVESLEEVMTQHANHLARFLVVDGVVWEHAREPRYVVLGGPPRLRLGTDYGAWVEITVTDTDNATDDPRHIFRADQHTAALADALAMAGELGVSGDRVTELAGSAPQITVHLPEAVRLVIPEQEHEDLRELREGREGLRQALRAADMALNSVDRHYADPERNPRHAKEFAEAWETLTRRYAQITALTDDVVGAHAVRRPYMPEEDATSPA